MPIPNLPDSITEPLARLRARSGDGATGFASNVVAVLDAMLNTTTGILGTASVRDTGTTEGTIPVLNADGEIAPALVPGATSEAQGAVLLARSITDARPGVVPTAAQITALAQTAATGLNAANFNITALTNNVDFTTPATGLILIAAAGGGGHSPPASGGYLSGGNGTRGQEARLRYGANLASASTASIRVLGGVGGGSGAAQLVGFEAVTTIDSTQASAPTFAFRLFQKGAQGGDPGAYDPDTRSAGGEVVGLPGSNGDLLIAKVEAGRTYRPVIGNGGAGAAATPTTTNTQSVAARAGLNGYALFVRLV